MEIDEIHLRHCILYEFRQGRNVTEAFQIISSIYNGVSESFCKYWYARFRVNNFSLINESVPELYIQEIPDEDVEQLSVQSTKRLLRHENQDISFDTADYNTQMRHFGDDLSCADNIIGLNSSNIFYNYDDNFKEVCLY